MTTTLGAPREWRVLDIVVGAMIAVAFGPVFLAWNALWEATIPLFAFFFPVQAILYGVWLLPGVLVGLVIRRPGAALLGAFVSAAVSVMLGSIYGADALISGAIQGLGAELGFLIFAYRGWGLTSAIVAGALSGLAAAVHDVLLYSPAVGVALQAAFTAFTVGSGALVAGVGAWLLMRALVRTGVLAEFEAGRGQERI